MNFIIFLHLIAIACAKLPCEYLSMVDNNLVVEQGISLCLGSCPPSGAMTNTGIYIGPGQTLFFPSFTLLTSSTNGGNTLTLQRSDGTAILTCDQRSCYSATVPSNAASLAPGFYLTGRPGSPPLSLNDPWQVMSNIDLVDGSNLQMVTLQQGVLGENPVTGWRLVVGNTSYAMTNRNQLVVGNVLASTILASTSANSVLAEGPVLVRNAQKSCPIPLPRPVQPSVVLIYATQPPAPNCNFIYDPTAFVYTVPINTCLASPFTAIANSPIMYAYFLVSGTNLQFFSDNLCAAIKGSATLNMPCTSNLWPWSAIFLPGNANMV